ncbi:helix-turn-helix domain-containing protein [Paenibacillus pasadenensis]|uniref:Transcriptional regulator, AraC family n=1 Tax=Paenibacillus pasadenensis TaxID=217090 RepID=A0A2N5N252_9BACL|nr:MULTISPECIES: AraC family transcriptional regulator [Paenibacillus]PLT44414.1 Transcriptional regulator, AraC family [Paenibacillus pasadenensis]QGG54898.1 helix-turn-helix domain-containing protein [Paenibacillus sp. B01]
MQQPGPRHRRIVAVELKERPLPLRLESLGFNPDQEPFHRPDGYSVYHWLQTVSGEGRIEWGGRSETLRSGSGLLLPPGAPHRYRSADDSIWKTVYMTFSGGEAAALLASLGLAAPGLYRWEEESPLGSLLLGSLGQLEAASDPLGLEASQQAYRFLLALGTYASADAGTAVMQQLRQLEPLLAWLEANLHRPAVGLDDMAAQAGVSGRRLNTLFRSLFGLSPYAYLLRLRIRRARELLLSRPGAPLRAIAQDSGFRDVSHFIATFRRLTGDTPDRFRSGRP